MSPRGLIPLEDGSAVEVCRTESSVIYVAASYYKKGGKSSLHRLLVQNQIANVFGARNIDASNTLPQVKTIKQGNLDDLDDSYKALAEAINNYLVWSLGKPTDRLAKHNVQYDFVIQRRDNPRLVSKYWLSTVTNRQVDALRATPLMKFKVDRFDTYLSALTDQRVLCLVSRSSKPGDVNK